MASPQDDDLAAAVDDGLRQVVLQGVRLLTAWLAPLFLLFSPFDWFYTEPAPVGHISAVMDLALAAVFLGVFLAVRRADAAARRANLAAGLMGLAVVPYVLVNVWTVATPVQTAGLALLQVGIALVLLSWPWVIALLVLSNFLWVAEVAWGLHTGHLAASPDWAQYGYILASSTVIAVVAHGVRFRTYSRLEGLRLAEHQRRIELEHAQLAARDVETMRRVNELKTHFINTAAHELATPMTPILLQLSVLRGASAGMTEEQLHSLGVLERNLHRLRDLLKDVLDSSRIQADRLPMAMDRVDFSRVLDDAAADYHEVVRMAGLRLEVDVAPGLWVRGDADRLHQVVGNLLHNAVKFTPRGGQIRLAARAEAGHAAVEVIDSGLGIAATDVQRLFSPFVQVHDLGATTVGGSGLGLYISKGIVEHQGGAIGCRSDGPGKGSVFWIRLPLASATTP
ncbi:MAG: HAMP domain-containing sensor histidine kinase [bacterium]